MANIKKIGTAVGTFGVALGIGFVMQNGDALASRFGSNEVTEQPALATEEEPAETSAVTSPASIDRTSDQAIKPALASLTFASEPNASAPGLETVVANAAVVLPETAKILQPSENPIQLATLDADIVPTAEMGSSVSADEQCLPAMNARAGQAATVVLEVTAPCRLLEAFTVHHQGLMFTAMTDQNGAANLTLPALAEAAVVIVAFEDGDGVVATAVVPDFAEFERAVLQWQGDEAVMLNAYENNARFGDDGHIYLDNPGNIARLDAGDGGYLVTLGDVTVHEPLMAEVYTFPIEKLGKDFDVLLVAEAEITAGNCGQGLSAQSIQVFPSGETSSLDLTVVMPDCDSVGDFLILQNMFEDPTIALK